MSMCARVSTAGVIIAMAGVSCAPRSFDLVAPTFACSRDDECAEGFACDGQRCRSTPNGFFADFAGWSDVVALGAVATEIAAVDSARGLTGASRFDRNLNPGVVVGFDPEHVDLGDDTLNVDTGFNVGVAKASSLSRGQKVSFATDGAGALPAPLAPGVGYFVIDAGLTRIRLAATEAQATRGEAISFTSRGTGSFVLLASASVRLAWEPFRLNRRVTPERVNVYRSRQAEGPWDDTTRIATATGTQFVDNDVVGGATYFYRVQPVLSGQESVAPLVADSVIQVFVPPDNMALVHRWVANREVCTNLLGATFPEGVDRAAHYSCVYRWGLRADGGHAFAPDVPMEKKETWDLGYSFVIDRFEAGCRVSPKPEAIGLSEPDSGTAGDVAAVRGPAEPVCMLYRNGRWSARYSTAYDEAERARMVTNAPGYPALIANQVDAYDACQRRRPAGVAAALRLMRMPELTISRAWNGVLTNPSRQDIAALLAPVDHRSAGSCHVADGMVSSRGLQSGDPGAFSQTTSNVFAFLAGSWGTRNCLSRYGTQDQVGNWREFVSERIRVPEPFVANSIFVSGRELDPDNLFVDQFRYDGRVGPGHAAGAGPATLVRTDLVTASGAVVPMFGLTSAGVDPALGARELGPLGPGAGFTFSSLFFHATAGGFAFPVHDGIDAAYASQMVGPPGAGLYQGRFVKQLPYGNPSRGFDSGSVWTSGEYAFEASGFRCVGQVGP